MDVLEKMDRYFFHLRNEAIGFDDLIGVSYTMLRGAEACALQIAKDLRKEPSYSGFELVITDEGGKVVLTIPIVPYRRALTPQSVAA
jgi:hypothetical protein